jgi:hypothetical protein
MKSNSIGGLLHFLFAERKGLPLDYRARLRGQKPIPSQKAVEPSATGLVARWPYDPNVLVMRVELALAEMWDGPASSAVAAYEFAKGRMTGTKPNLGEKRKVAVRMD